MTKIQIINKNKINKYLKDNYENGVLIEKKYYRQIKKTKKLERIYLYNRHLMMKE